MCHFQTKVAVNANTQKKDGIDELVQEEDLSCRLLTFGHDSLQETATSRKSTNYKHVRCAITLHFKSLM